MVSAENKTPETLKVLEKPKSLKIKEFDVSVKNAKEEIRIPEKPTIEV